MVAPVVLITLATIFGNGLLTAGTAVRDRSPVRARARPPNSTSGAVNAPNDNKAEEAACRCNPEGGFARSPQLLGLLESISEDRGQGGGRYAKQHAQNL